MGLAVLVSCGTGIVSAQPTTIERTVRVSAPHYTIRMAAFIPSNNLEGFGFLDTGLKPPGAYCDYAGPDATPDNPPEPAECSSFIEITGDLGNTVGGFYRRELFFTGDDRSFDSSTPSYRMLTEFEVFPSEASDARPGVEDGLYSGPAPHRTGVTRSFAPDAVLDGVISGADNDGVTEDCELLHDQDQAETHGMSHTPFRSGSKSMRVSLRGAAPNPLVIGPDIDWDVHLRFWIDGNGTGRVELTGSHDGFPAYELWAVTTTGEQQLAGYDPGAPATTSCAGTSSYSWAQGNDLFGLGSPPFDEVIPVREFVLE
jgi:hypothetical protein